MIIERLEQELHAAERRLDLTIERVASPNDPEAARARQTVDKLAGLMARIDTVLVEAVDEFPTSFDFLGRHADRGGFPRIGLAQDAGRSRFRTEGNARRPATHDVNHPAAYGREPEHRRPRSAPEGSSRSLQTPDDPSQGPPYDEHSLAQAAQRVEWSRKMLEKGYVSKAHHDFDVKAYDALLASRYRSRYHPRSGSCRLGEADA